MSAKEEKTENSGKHQDEWVFLTTVSNDIEYGIVAALLETAEIPVMRKVEGVDYIVGGLVTGVEVFVPSARYEEAVELTAEQPEMELPGEEE